MTDPLARFVDHPAFHLPDAEQSFFTPGEPLPPLPPPTLFAWGDCGVKPTLAPLRHEDERRLFLRFNYARHRYAAADGATDAARWAETAKHLREYLTRINMPLIPYAIKLMQSRIARVEYEDAISDGMMSLFNCVDRFDAGRGFKFSTYVVPGVMNALTRRSADDARRRRRIPLYGDSAHAHSRLYAKDCPAALAEGADNAAAVRRAIAAADLSDQERVVLDARYNNGDTETYRSIGVRLGRSPQRMRQVNDSAVAKVAAVLAASDA